MNAWAKSLLKKYQSMVFPSRLTIEITSECNYKCVHCYHPEHVPLGNELSKGEILSVVDQFREQGLFHVTLTGGEPLMRKDITEIVGELSQRRIRLDIYTNASLINEENIGLFCNKSIDGVQISVYAISENTYDFITGTKGNYKKHINAMKLLFKYGVPVNASLIVMKQNYDEVAEMEAMCKSYGFSVQYGLRILADRDDIRKKEYELSNFQKSYIFNEFAPFEVIARSDDFSVDWQKKVLDGYVRDIKKCAICDDFAYCSICPGVIFSENGTVRDFKNSSLCNEVDAVKMSSVE